MTRAKIEDIARRGALVLDAVSTLVEKDGNAPGANASLEKDLVSAIGDLGELLTQMTETALGVTEGPAAVPFTPPVWERVEPTWGDPEVMEWDAVIGEDLWTLRRSYDMGVRWHLHGTAVPSNTPYFVGETHMEARHSAHLIIRNHYRPAGQEKS